MLSGQDTIPVQEIETIFVEATRINVDILKSPLSVEKFQSNKLNAANQNFATNEYLNQIPGIFSINQNNSAQDLRISIRGFGARSAFGIRGVKLIVDGIPLTTPDGQGQIDNVWVGGIKNTEIIKGSASSLYGNASGGVILLNTFNSKAEDFSRLGLSYGSFANQNFNLEIKKTLHKVLFQGQLAYTNADGYRDQSRFKNLNFSTSFATQIKQKHSFELLFSLLNSPIGEDPGGVNLTSIMKDRKAARDQNILFNAGESLNQVNNALKYKFEIGDHLELSANAFYSYRKLDALLPFANGGSIDLTRDFGGIISHMNYNKETKNGNLQLVFGIDYLYQNDLRQRFYNNEGVKGIESTNQNEIFINKAIYLTFQQEYLKFLIQGGIRYDNNQIYLEDNFLQDGKDDSGDLKLPNFSPSLGLSYEISKYQYLFSSFSYGFETPAMSELSNRPDNQGGLNENLLSQDSYNYEIGYKARFSEKLNTQMSIFNIITNNEILPYEIASFPGRTFYRNSGITNRKGIELSLKWQVLKNLDFYFAYTESNFKFSEYFLNNEDLSDNIIPGIPKTNLYSSLTFEKGTFYLQFDTRYVSKIYLNDNNSDVDKDFIIGNIKASKIFEIRDLSVVPYFGVNNLWNTKYNDNIRINSFGGRYYEPAPGINFYFGLKFEF